MQKKSNGKKDNNSYDVIIIGSGVSGTASAIRCLNAGLSCLMITGNVDWLDSSFQTTPTESVHPGVETILRMLSRANLLTSCCRGRYSSILNVEGKNVLAENEIWRGYHLDKPLFVKSLITAAILIGLDLKTDDMVVGILKESDSLYKLRTTSGNRLLGRRVIDASGRRQIAGKLLHLKKSFYSPSLLCYTGLIGNINEEIFDQLQTSFTKKNDKWIWLAPEENYCCTWTTLSLQTQRDYGIPKELSDFTSIAAPRVRNIRWRLYDSLIHEGIVLTGDAAGILDPSSGQGILSALMSALMAADCVIDYFNSKKDNNLVFKRYDEWFRHFYLAKAKMLQSYYLEEFRHISLNRTRDNNFIFI